MFEARHARTENSQEIWVEFNNEEGVWRVIDVIGVSVDCTEEDMLRLEVYYLSL